jgi:hypothetical protein
MATLKAVLDATRRSVDDLMAAAEQSGAGFTLPRAPGKWSPSQVVEHVARSLEESANVVAGAPSKFPTFPFFLRPLVRNVFFNRVLKKQGFPKARTTKAMNPLSGPATTAEARLRLADAFEKFDRECRTLAARGQLVPSTLFGGVTVEDFARFQELHTRHHCKQIPVGEKTAALSEPR